MIKFFVLIACILSLTLAASDVDICNSNKALLIKELDKIDGFISTDKNTLLCKTITKSQEFNSKIINSCKDGKEITAENLTKKYLVKMKKYYCEI